MVHGVETVLLRWLTGYVWYTTKIEALQYIYRPILVMLVTSWMCMYALTCLFVYAIHSKAWKVQLLLPINGVLIAQRIHAP